jgi:cytochrome c peroxidase
MAGGGILALALLAAVQATPHTTPQAEIGAAERDVLLELSPLPDPPPDPTNAVHADPAAARLGQALFFDRRLSADATVSCATCHVPEQSWTDGRPLARGVSALPRHTMTLWNVAHNRWFFWDGRKDTLWSQALAPLEDEREHATSRLAVLHVLHADEGYRRAYTDVFGPLPELTDATRFPRDARPTPETPEQPHHVAWQAMSAADQEAATRAFVNVGKALAAFQRNLVSRAAPFDEFVEGLRTGDAQKVAALSPAAQRGAALFAGKARCFLCHDGPLLSDLEFHDNRVPVGEEGGDPGRKLGIRRLQADPFNSRSVFADDGGEAGRIKVGLLVSDSHGGKLFKTPTLRNIARTAPYMHEGQLATLADVVRFYDTLEGAAPESGSERIIQPLGLTEEERADLVAFLESLTDEGLPAELKRAPETPYLER